MPLIDMPLDELKSYNGLSPKPTDFDEYWDKALAELDKTDTNVELVSAEFQYQNVECFDLYFTGVGGARIHGKYVRPAKNLKKSEKMPAILLFHGYSGAGHNFASMMSYAIMGYSVFSMDCRGQGGCSEDTLIVKGTTFKGHIIRGLSDSPDKLLFKYIFLDTAQLARVAMQMPEVDIENVYCHGGSQGGGLSTVCASLEPRIKRASIVFPFLSDYKRTWEMDLFKHAYDELSYYFRSFDPRHEQEDEIFYKLGYIDIQYLAPRIKADVLFFTGLMDIICPPSTQFAVYNKISSNKKMHIYPDFGHEALPDSDELVMRFFS